METERDRHKGRNAGVENDQSSGRRIGQSENVLSPPAPEFVRSAAEKMQSNIA